VTLLFTRTKKLQLTNVSTGSTTKRLLKKDFAKQTETQILENLILPKNDKANEARVILQTQFTRNFAEEKGKPILKTLPDEKATLCFDRLNNR
jgi:hypothetical protein